MLVTIVGVGALGSHVLQFLRNEPNTNFKLIDCKRVESKNVISQFHAKTTVGKLKVDALKQTSQFLFGETPKIVSVISNRLTNLNVEALLIDSALVIDCLDNSETRRVIQRFCSESKINCLHGGVAANAAFAQIGWEDGFVIDEDNNVDAPTCENGEHLPFLVATSAWMAQAAHIFLQTGKRLSCSLYPQGMATVSGS